MNTQTNKLLTALTSVLAAPPFVIKINDERVTALQSVINGVLPATVDKLTDTTRAMLPSLNGGAMFDTLTDNIVIHIPAFYKSIKTLDTTGNKEFFVEKQTVTFTLDSYTEQSVRFFSLALGLLSKTGDRDLPQSHLDNLYLTKFVNKVIPTLQGLQGANLSIVTTLDYNAIARNFGLASFILPCVTWENYYKGDNEKGICGITAVLELSTDNTDIVNSSCDAIEALCTVSKKKNESNVFYFTATNGTVWELIQSAKTERVGRGSKDIAYRYQFRVSKATK